jgi:hypothetical protein
MVVTLFIVFQEALLFAILPLIDRIVPTTVIQRKCSVGTLSHLVVGIFVPFPTAIDSFDYLDLARCGRLSAVGDCKESHVNVFFSCFFRGKLCFFPSHSPLLSTIRDSQSH